MTTRLEVGNQILCLLQGPRAWARFSKSSDIAMEIASKKWGITLTKLEIEKVITVLGNFIDRESEQKSQFVIQVTGTAPGASGGTTGTGGPKTNVVPPPPPKGPTAEEQFISLLHPKWQYSLSLPMHQVSGLQAILDSSFNRNR